MFDLTSSKLLILGIVALIVVGPKELPFLLRTVGKYVGMIRRHANEFRAQFDEAMREAELDSIKKDLESVARDTENTIRSAQTSVEHDIHATTRELDQSIKASGEQATEFVRPHDTLDAADVSRSTDAASAPASTMVPSDAVSDVAVPVPAPAPDAIPQHLAATVEHQQPELAKTGT